jgi:hypothetical protein
MLMRLMFYYLTELQTGFCSVAVVLLQDTTHKNTILNPISFAICTSTLSKLCKQHIKQHVEECSVMHLCN